MPSVSRYRTWLAVPADEIEDLKKAHPPMNGHTPVIWDKEHKLWFARPGADLSRLDRWLPRPQDVSMNGSDPVTEFAQVLENAGLVLKELPVMDGKIHRVPTADDKKGQKSGAYRGFLDGRPAGWYRDYRSADDSPITWTFSGGEQTDPRARLHLKAHSMQRREDAERELKAQYNRQAAYARRYVNKWPQATAHEYLTRKGIQAAPGVRVNNKNELVIPFSNRNGAIRSYQRIPVIAVDLNNVAGDKTPAGRLKTGIMYLLAGQIAGGDFTLPQYRDEVLKQLPREYHEIALKRINQLDQEVKTKVYDELHNARGIDFIWENLDTQEREQRKFAIRTVLSTQYLRDYPESVLKSANTLWLLRYKPEDIPVLRDNFNVPEFMLKRFLKMPEGPAPDGSGVPVLGVFRVKSGTLARILKFTVGPLELWALNSSPKDSALRKTLTNKLGSVRARKILAENFPRGSATSLIEHRAGQHNSDNVIEELASELIRKQGYNL
ncbi:TPA: hypothetical protein N2Y11_004018 [Escherichia coli]|nr:hypothetical protein [Escherichia coli]